MPLLVRSAYTQSKDSTKRLSEWLARSATQYGFSLSNFKLSAEPLANDQTAQPTSQAQKSKQKKARQKAKKKEQAGCAATNGADGEEENGEGETGSSQADTTPPPPRGSYIIELRQFVEIAQFLVDKAAKIPDHVEDIVASAIHSRLEHTHRWFSDPDDSTWSHLHFISQLQSVQSIFKKYKARSGAAAAAVKQQPASNAIKGKSASKISSASKAGLANRFASLAVSRSEDANTETEAEEEKADIQLPPPSRPSGAAISTMHLSFDLEDTKETALEMLLLFFHDMHSVRKCLRELWSEYRAGEMDLLTASVTTNTALELLRRPHNDVVATVLPFFNEDLAEATAELCHFLLQRGGLDPLPRPLPSFVDLVDYPEAVQNVFEYLFIPNLQFLDGLASMLKGLKEDHIPVYKSGYFGQYDPTLDFKNADYATRWQHGRTLVGETLGEYLTFTYAFEPVLLGRPTNLKPRDKAELLRSNPLTIEELASELDSFARTRKFTLLLMCQSQCFIDMNFELGTSAKRGFEELRTCAARMLASFKDYQSLHRSASARHPGWPPANEDQISAFMSEASIWTAEVDPVTTVLRCGSSSRTPSEDQPSTLMQRNPMLAGAMLFRLQIAYQNIGFTIANRYGMIMFSAHLVIACRHSGRAPWNPSAPVWPDIDKIMEIHKSEDIFGGPVPDDVLPSLHAFWKQAGAPPEFLQTMSLRSAGAEPPEHLVTRAQAAVQANKKGPATLQDHTKILPIFRDKYLGNTAGTCIDINIVEQLLKDIRARDEVQKLMQQRDDATGVMSRSKSKAQKRNLLRKERSHRTAKYSVPELLAVLEAGLRSETESIRFDYVSMHVRCMRALKAVKAASHAYLAGKHGPNYLVHDYELPAIVGQILHVSVHSRRQGIEAGFSLRPGQKFASKLLTGATETLETFLQSRPNEGSQELIKLRRSTAAQ